MASPPPSTTAEVDSIHGFIADITSTSDNFDNPRRFSAFASRLRLLLNHRDLLRPQLPPAVNTALRGIAADLRKALETVSVYRKRSKIFVLIHCKSLAGSLGQHSAAIGSWLALIESSLNDEVSDLRKKTSDLSQDMKQANFSVTENEARVQFSLEKEAEATRTRKAVQSAILMDLARALGVVSDNHKELSEQIKLLKDDLSNSSSVTDRRILVSLERILDNWSIIPGVELSTVNGDLEDEAHILPFKNFLCPLTKEVMKEPVVLESSQTYEKSAIQYWFERCLEDGREPTCPVTGRVLESTEVKLNIGLAGAIEEWVNRNDDILVKSVVELLNKEPPKVESVERALDIVYKISEEHPLNRYKVRNAGVVELIVKLLASSSKNPGSLFRSKALMALLSIAKDEESKKIMIEEGITRLAVHGLIGSSEKEKEFAVKLLLEFSTDEEYCLKIASEKGALVLLSSMSENPEHPSLANLAEEVLKHVEGVEDNIQPLATAGRFEPLLRRLQEGPDDVRIKMASVVGRMALTNNSKEQIARLCAKPLVRLLSKPNGRTSCLQALYNLSGLDDNATILVESDVLPALMDILFQSNDASLECKELSASIFGKIVSNSGCWELAAVDKKGNSMQSEFTVMNLLGLLSITSPRCQAAILHILCGLTCSPQAAESVIKHVVNSDDGLKTIISFLEHPEVEDRIYAFKLTKVLTERSGQELARELRSSNKLNLLKDKLLDNKSTEGERSDAACILANIPLSEDEVKSILPGSFVKWIVSTLKSERYDSNGRASRPTSGFAEGLLGLLLKLTRIFDQETYNMVKEHQLMNIFCEHLSFPSKPRAKQLAATGLKNLSEACLSFAVPDSKPPPPNGFCGLMMFMCRETSSKASTCAIHNLPCEESRQLCLLESNCIKPLVDLLPGDDTNVQIAAVEALSTLLLDTSHGSKKAADELERLGVLNMVVDLFTQIHPGVLQERTLWLIERILRAEGPAHRCSLNQPLVRALVEAFKHGTPNARRHARDALTNLKQISVVSGRGSSQSVSRRQEAAKAIALVASK